MHGTGCHPVHERRLVEETNAIDGWCDEVVALEHLASDLNVDGVDVVEEAGGEEAADLKNEPKKEDDDERDGTPKASRGSASGERSRALGLLRRDGQVAWWSLALAGSALADQPGYCNGVRGRSDQGVSCLVRRWLRESVGGWGSLGLPELSRGRSVKRALPELSKRRIFLLPRSWSTISRFSMGTKRSLRSPWPHTVSRSCEVRKMGGASGKVPPKSMEEGAAVDEIYLSAEVEGDRGAVRLIAVEEDFGIRGDGVVGFELLHGVGEAAGREHGGKACERYMSCDEEGSRSESDSYGRSQVPALRAEKPSDGRAGKESYGGKRGWETQCREAGTGEVEDAGHGEGVVAYAPVGEDIADVGNEGQVAGAPEAVDQRDGNGHAEDGEGGVGDGDPASRGGVEGEGLLGVGEGDGKENEMIAR